MNEGRAELFDWIASYRPQGEVEERARARFLALLEESPDPWSRAVFAPGHLTASAVVTDPARRRALLVFHPKLRRWLQPGGHFEAGERDPVAAAAREVLEETGFRVRGSGGRPPLLDLDVHRIPANAREPAHEHFDLRFHFVAEGLPVAQATHRLRWVEGPLGEDESLDRALRKALDFAARPSARGAPHA